MRACHKATGGMASCACPPQSPVLGRLADVSPGRARSPQGGPCGQEPGPLVNSGTSLLGRCAEPAQERPI